MGSIDTLLVIYPEIAFDSTLFRGTSVAGTVQITQLDLFTKVFSRNHALNLTDVMLTDKEAINNQVNTFWKSNEGHSYFINLAETSALDEVHNAVTLKTGTLQEESSGAQGWKPGLCLQVRQTH